MVKLPNTYEEYLVELERDTPLELFPEFSDSAVYAILQIWCSAVQRVLVLEKACREGDIHHLSFYYSTVKTLEGDGLIAQTGGHWKITEIGQTILSVVKNSPSFVVDDAKLGPTALLIVLILFRQPRKTRPSELEHKLVTFAMGVRTWVLPPSHSTFFRLIGRLLVNEIVMKKVVVKTGRRNRVKRYYALTRHGFDLARWLYKTSRKLSREFRSHP